jgi:hypothetical protein
MEFVPPELERYTSGPLGNQYQHRLQAHGQGLNHKVILDYGTSKVLAMNEIELDMQIPTIESQASKISRDEGNTYTGLIESWHRGSSDMIIDEYVGVNMGFQIPLLIIDRRSCLHILKPVGHTLNAY